MALSYSWAGVHETPTVAARIVARSTGNGTLTAVLDGTTYTGTTISTATDDGIGTVDVTGLSPGQSYTVALSVDGASVGSQIVKTLPADTLRLVWASCTSAGSPSYWAAQARDRTPDVLIMQGDTPYTDTTSEPDWAIDSVTNSGNAATTVATYYAHHQRERNSPGYTELSASGVAQAYMPDDHEWPGDNWDHSIAQSQAGNADIRNTAGITDPPTQAEVDSVWYAGLQGAQAYMLGNPANSDTGPDNEKPSSAAAGTATSQYPPNYFRFGNSVAEVFVIDCHTHRSPIAATDDASKTMLGSLQKAWLKARLSASTATFKIISTGKYLFPLGDEAAGGDRWDKFSTERDELLAYIEANVTGVIWLAGDKHVPNVAAAYTSEGASWDAVCATACPCGVNVSTHATSLGTYTRGIYAESESTTGQVIGVLDVSATRATLSMVRVRDGSTIPLGYVAAASNALSHDATTLGVI